MLLTFAAVFGAARSKLRASSHSTPPRLPGRPPPNGFLQRWLVLEPIRVQIRSNAELRDSFVQAALKKEYFTDQFTVVPHDGDKVTVSDVELAWHAVDSGVYNVNLFHFASALGKPTYNVVFWAVTIVNCPEDIPNVRLSVGSNASSIWWVNGKEVIDLYGDLHMVMDFGVSKRFTLHKGPTSCAALSSTPPESVISAPVFST